MMSETQNLHVLISIPLKFVWKCSVEFKSGSRIASLQWYLTITRKIFKEAVKSTQTRSWDQIRSAGTYTLLTVSYVMC